MDDELILLERYCNGDNQALATLFLSWQKEFFFYAYRFVKNEDDAQDVLSDCLEKALLFSNEVRAEKFLVQQVQLKAFLMVMIKNKALDYIKTKSNKNRILEGIKHLFIRQTANDALRDLEQHHIDHLFSGLNDRERALIKMDLEGYSIDEMSRHHNIAKKTVSNILSDSRRKMKLILQQHS